MVIHNLNVERVASFESEAHSPLIIDSNAPTPFPVALQSFQPVPGRASRISNGLRGIEHLQLSLGNNRNRPEPSRRSVFKKGLGVVAPKALNHNIKHITRCVKRQGNNVAEGAGLPAGPENRDVPAGERLHDEVADDPAVVGVHARPVGVEDPHHPDVQPVLTVVVEEQRLGAARALVVAGARADAVGVAPVALGLGGARKGLRRPIQGRCGLRVSKSARGGSGASSTGLLQCSAERLALHPVWASRVAVEALWQFRRQV